MDNLPLTPPGWDIVRLLLVTSVVFVTWQVLSWLRAKIK